MIGKDTLAGALRELLSPLGAVVSNGTRPHMSVGVDVGRSNLRLSKILRDEAGGPRLVDYKLVPFKQEVLPDKPEFVGFLHSVLRDFCGASRDCRIWATFPSYQVNIRHLQVPRMPAEQLSSAVYWAFRRESPFEDSEVVFDFEVEDEVLIENAPKYNVMAYTAPRREVEELKGLFTSAGYPLTGVTFPLFAIRNLFRAKWIEPAGKTVVLLSIGNDYSRASVFHGGKFVMTRGIKSGLQTLLYPLMQEVKTPMTAEQASKLLFSLGAGFPSVTEADPGYQMSRDEIFAIIQPSLERLARQFERTIEHYHLAFKQERADKAYVAGDLAACEPVMDYLRQQLGMEFVVMDPFASRRIDRLLAAPTSHVESVLFAQAVGVGLAEHCETPNLLMTRGDREEGLKAVRINRRVFTVFAAFAALCAVIFLQQLWIVQRSWSARIKAEHQLARFHPRLSTSLITTMVGTAQQKQISVEVSIRRYLGLSVITEISALTPDSVRLSRVSARLGAIDGQSAPKETPGIVIEGVVSGERPVLESSLAMYIARLEGSPVFEQVRVKSSRIEVREGSHALFFVLETNFPEALVKSPKSAAKSGRG
jgi:type IV pilus assembly protein PilM